MQLMKSYPIHRWCRVSSFVILGAVLLVAYRSDPNLFKSPRVESATSVNITGYAWANTPQSTGTSETGTDQGLGWIRFNGENHGVTLDLETGNFSGHAWIGNGDDGAGSTGWIDFAPTTGFPGAPFHGVRRVDNTLIGWAKVVSMGDDGWIKMSKDASDGGADYGVTIAVDGAFSGYAWGSDVIGWVNFASEIAVAEGSEVHLDTATCTPDNVILPWGSCNDDPEFCSSYPSRTPIPGTQLGTCGGGYSGYASQDCSTGLSCGSSPCTSDDDCGGGETCLPGTSTCGSGATGCGNGTCNVGESLLTCPQDCKGTIRQF